VSRGFGFGVGGRSSGGTAVFDPGTLALTTWIRGSYGGAPWAQTASAGASGSNGDWVTGDAPDVGAAQGGYTPADFNGSTDVLTNAKTMADLFSTTGSGDGSIIALIYGENASTAASAGYDEDGILADSGGYIGLTYVSNGGSFDVGGYMDGVAVRRKACSASTWHLAVMRWSGGTLGLSVDGGAEDTGSSSSYTSTGTASLGHSAFGGHFNGRIMELMTMASRISDVNITNIISYVNSRYGLAI
jgi:hypothetical protein